MYPRVLLGGRIRAMVFAAPRQARAPAVRMDGGAAADADAALPWVPGISCTVRRAKLTICLERNQTNKVFQTIWKEKPDGTVQRDIKIQKGSTWLIID
uniref:Uncharacterized protein n=2 Tax=Oryza glumipatula TaxID=40148 RepID=A0A0E0BAN6_9ORYZ